MDRGQVGTYETRPGEVRITEALACKIRAVENGSLELRLREDFLGVVVAVVVAAVDQSVSRGEVHASCIGPREVSAVNPGVIETRVGEVGSRKDCAANLCPGEVRARQLVAGEVHAGEVGIGEVASCTSHSTDIQSSDTCAGEVRPWIERES